MMQRSVGGSAGAIRPAFHTKMNFVYTSVAMVCQTVAQVWNPQDQCGKEQGDS